MTVLLFPWIGTDHAACFVEGYHLGISPGLQATTKVRAVRFCDYLNNDTPRQIQRMDMILLDEEGKAIEAQIPQRWIGTCRPRLKEDSVYYIKFFQVVSAKTSFCTVDHAYMIRFTGHTQITEIKLVPVAFPLYACTPVPFSVLHDRLHITEYTSDTIGVLCRARYKTTPKCLHNKWKGRCSRGSMGTRGREFWRKPIYEYG